MKNNTLRLLMIFLALPWMVACATPPMPIAPGPTNTATIFTKTIQPLTQTLVPTLTMDEANTEIQQLLSTAENCSFPCWWDLTPGQTSMEDASNFLNRFSVFSVGTPRLDSEEGYLRLIVPQAEDSYLHFTFVYKGQKDVLERLWLRIQMMHKVTYADGQSGFEVSWGDPLLAKITKPYTLSHVLTKYGLPSKVLIRTYQASLLNQPWPISLVLYYPNQGFMIEYVADGKAAPNSSVAWCSSLAFSNFWFWPPSKEITLIDAVSRIPGEQLDRENLESGSFKSIEEATGMSIEEFYSLFKNNEDKCIETPINIWPMPRQ